MSSKFKISIIIPTIKYTRYLDNAIESCLNAKFIDIKIFVNINSNSPDFEKSPYWNSDRVHWRHVKNPVLAMHENWNDAIKHSTGKWLFILSDDDVIKENFLEEISGSSNISPKTLFMTRIDFINEDDEIIKVQPPFRKRTYTQKEIMILFFKNFIPHHLSLLIFSRELFEKVGKFEFAGYPNGYYIDVIFHGKMFAHCDSVKISKQVIFSRRESSFQCSSKFYFRHVNQYFRTISDAMCNDTLINKYILKEHGTKEKYYRSLIEYRVGVEWQKLNARDIKHVLLKKIELTIMQLFYNTSNHSKWAFIKKVFSSFTKDNSPNKKLNNSYQSIIMLLEFIESLSPKETYILYGYGSIGKIILPHIKGQVTAIIDQSLSAQLIENIYDIPVIVPEELIYHDNVPIIITPVIHQKNISKILERYGNPLVKIALE